MSDNIENNPKGKLNQRQERFCELYASDEEFFGNGVASYVEAYDVNQSKPNWYKSAAASASRLLKNVKICEYINNKLEENGLNDQFIDKQLKFLITQHADFTNKLGAIKEYNQLNQRIKKKIDKFEEDGHATEYENLSEQELDAEIKRRQNKIPKIA